VKPMPCMFQTWSAENNCYQHLSVLSDMFLHGNDLVEDIVHWHQAGENSGLERMHLYGAKRYGLFCTGIAAAFHADDLLINACEDSAIGVGFSPKFGRQSNGTYWFRNVSGDNCLGILHMTAPNHITIDGFKQEYIWRGYSGYFDAVRIDAQLTNLSARCYLKLANGTINTGNNSMRSIVTISPSTIATVTLDHIRTTGAYRNPAYDVQTEGDPVRWKQCRYVHREYIPEKGPGEK